jgi:hypothetical protein
MFGACPVQRSRTRAVVGIRDIVIGAHRGGDMTHREGRDTGREGARETRGVVGSEERLLLNPTSALRSYIDSKSGDWGWEGTGEELGRLEVGLSIETRRRLIAQAVGNALLHLSREEVCSVLQALLVDIGLWELVQEWYERLCDWEEENRVRFKPILDADGVYSGHAVPDAASSGRGGRRRARQGDEGSGKWLPPPRIVDPYGRPVE